MHFLKLGNQECRFSVAKPSVGLTILLFSPDTLNQGSPDEISTTSFVGGFSTQVSIELTKMYTTTMRLNSREGG